MHGLVDQDGDLAVRAAWLSFAGGLTQEQIAERLGLSRVKVARLIARAQAQGYVRVFVEGPINGCLRLEDRLVERFGLTACRVVPSLSDEPLPLAALGPAGAWTLKQILDRKEVTVVGMGHGRTLAAAVQMLPAVSRPDMTFVSLLGSLTRSAATHPFDVITRLSDRTGGSGYFMPAPFRCDSAEDRAVFLKQRSLREVFALTGRAQVMVVGVGAVKRADHMVEVGLVSRAEQQEVLAVGAVGEILGLFIDAEGRPVDSKVNERSIAVGLEALRDKETIVIAGGHGKARAVRAALRTGVIRHLVTDEATAARILEGEAT
ncbi:DNA-binding transcriptional regulator LsrR, DeoR family [Tistlia consotensis]|uniref:DNA-binding transcriptional regulator LsrR, DeoR family n=1 Tax=Tistlia consotensis USBA 355 TaxID=560819 RepID=A0A1Y6BPH7_9PROT|nr:sugar-binding transcriptional regulator [Tistlia consotensis]SMF21848.1 DNA-binding transcriptional regulator LsrR, DeoR family [Tistlia consotensis USBA 355]SNR46510.1 DNA-binding transcriptional regulator LsrR, DeoR family [Tistlia consotensis]